MKSSMRIVFNMILWAAVGVIGGLMHGQHVKITWRNILASMFVSMFSGMIGSFIFSEYIHNQTMLGGISALCGYFGQLASILVLKLWHRS